MATQWRVGFSGAIGLDYNALPIVASKEYNSPEWPQIMEDLRVMEDAVLAMMREKK